MSFWRLIVAFALVLGGCTPLSEVSETSTSGSIGNIRSFDGTEVPLDERTAEDYAKRMATCMRDLGWQAEAVGPPDADWRVTYGSASEQGEEFLKATRDCTEAIGYAGALEYTDEQLEKLYRRALEVRDCLETQGYEVSDPPTLDVYKESNAGWNPYSDVSAHEPAVVAGLTEQCRPIDLAETGSSD